MVRRSFFYSKCVLDFDRLDKHAAVSQDHLASSLIPLCQERNVEGDTSHVAVTFIYRQILMTIRVVIFADICIVFRHSLLKL